jgi:hypothetical protein
MDGGIAATVVFGNVRRFMWSMMYSRPGVVEPPNEPKMSHSRPSGTPADTTRSGTHAPRRNGEAGQLLAAAR